MKTKLFLIAGLILAGFLFQSCQKDNDLVNDRALAQDNNTDLIASKDLAAPGENSDELTNYPDPFTDMTIIEYKVPRPAWVTIIVYNRQEQFAIRLVSEFKHEGIYRVEFNAKELPVGEYVAEMRIGMLVFRENMTKIFKDSIGKIPKGSH